MPKIVYKKLEENKIAYYRPKTKTVYIDLAFKNTKIEKEILGHEKKHHATAQLLLFPAHRIATTNNKLMLALMPITILLLIFFLCSYTILTYFIDRERIDLDEVRRYKPNYKGGN